MRHRGICRRLFSHFGKKMDMDTDEVQISAAKLVDAAEHGQTDTVTSILIAAEITAHVFPDAVIGAAVCSAARFGHAAILRQFTARAAVADQVPIVRLHEAVRRAAQHNHVESVHVLIEEWPARGTHDRVLLWKTALVTAVKANKHAVIQHLVLLTHYIPNAIAAQCVEESIQAAAKSGSTEIIAALGTAAAAFPDIVRVDVNAAVTAAAVHGHLGTARALLDASNSWDHLRMPVSGKHVGFYRILQDTHCYHRSNSMRVRDGSGGCCIDATSGCRDSITTAASTTSASTAASTGTGSATTSGSQFSLS